MIPLVFNLRKIQALVFLVLTPLLLGILLYVLAETVSMQGFVRNYLPDFLWAFSLISAFSIIWNNKIPYYWWFVLALAFAGWDYGQYKGFVQGTGDPMDLIAYALGWLASPIIIHRYFRFHTSKP